MEIQAESRAQFWRGDDGKVTLHSLRKKALGMKETDAYAVVFRLV